MVTPLIREARPADTNALVALGDATGIFGPGETDLLLRGTLDVLHLDGLDAGHVVRVWEDPVDATPAGWVYFGPQHGPDMAWELFWIGVHPSHHGKGIGDALLTFVEDYVMSAGGRSLVIETSSLPSLARARRFYAERDYTARLTTPNHFGDGDDKVTYVKSLLET